MNDTVTKLMARVHAIENLASLAADPMTSGSEHMEYVNNLIAEREALEAELTRLFTPLTDELIKEALIQSMSLLEFAKACNGVTVFDPIALDEALSALHKAMQEDDRVQAYMLAHKERIPHGITGESNET